MGYREMSGVHTDRILHPLPKQGSFRTRGEMDELRQWWQDGPKGLCVLVGALGSGKSMLAGRLLQDLRVGPVSGQIPLADRPRFICSFEDKLGEVGADTCAAFLRDWLAGEPLSPGTPLTLELVRKSLAEVTQPMLIVLDGIERVLKLPPLYPEYGMSPPGLLDQVLADAVAGHYPQVAWLVTGRFPPHHARTTALDNYDFGDLYEESYLLGGRSEFYRPILIDHLPIESCIDLLRDGCRLQASTPALRDLAERCGCNAQMVVLVGAYLNAFAGGDLNQANLAALFDLPPVDKSLPRGLQEVRQFYQRRAEGVRKVVERFREQLKRGDPATLALLERLSLFFHPPTAKMLERIFLGKDKYEVSGKFLKKLDATGLNQRLEYLQELRLVERRDSPDGQVPQYSVPAGTKLFLSLGMNKTQRQAAHHAIATVMAEQTRRIDMGIVHSDQLPLWFPEASREAPRELDWGGQARNKTSYYWTEHISGLSMANKLADQDALVEHMFHLVNGGRMSEAVEALEKSRASGSLSSDRQQLVIGFVFGGNRPYECPLPEGLDLETAAYLLFRWGVAEVVGAGRLPTATAAFQKVLELEEHSSRAWIELRAHVGVQLATSLNFLGEARRILTEMKTWEEWVEQLGSKKLKVGLIYFKEMALAYAGEVRELLGSLHGNLFSHDYRRRRWLGLPIFSTPREYVQSLQMYPNVATTRAEGVPFEDDWYLHNYQLPNVSKEQCLRAGERALQIVGRSDSRIVESCTLVEVLGACLHCIKEFGASVQHAKSPDTLNAQVQRSRQIQERLEAHFERAVVLVRRGGYSIQYADLLFIRAHLLLLLARDINDIRVGRMKALGALFGLHPVVAGEDPYSAEPRQESDPPQGRGIFPPPESGLPRILAITHPDCGYFWGELEHRQILAEADLLEAAIKLGTNRFDPTVKQGGEVDKLIASGKEQLRRLVKMHEDVDAQRPEGHAPDSDFGRVRELLANVEAGQLPEPPSGIPDGMSEDTEWFLEKHQRAAELFRSEPELRRAYQSWLEIVGISIFCQSKWQELVNLEQWQLKFPELKTCPRNLGRFFMDPVPPLSLETIVRGDIELAWYAIRFRHEYLRGGVYHSEREDVPPRLLWSKYRRMAYLRMEEQSAG